MNTGQVSKLNEISAYSIDDIKNISDLPEKARQLTDLFDIAASYGLKSVKFDPTIIRGIDYYDGNIFEQFDMTPGNNRSMFGGGRYNGLVSLFIDKQVPAVGFAPGDITLLDFLSSWKLLPQFKKETKILVTTFPNNDDCLIKSVKTAEELRKHVNTILYTSSEDELSKQLKYADRSNIPYLVIIGPEELKKDTYLVKNMASGEQFSCLTVADILKLTS
ncbi:ATP phosphoribosyltransferase regulatory subunit [candidate division WWE3 bacterium]|nr:ATP phosphoribosyltransferase regulatory subunit [candidate division WWE3 bacterium]